MATAGTNNPTYRLNLQANAFNFCEKQAIYAGKRFCESISSLSFETHSPDVNCEYDKSGFLVGLSKQFCRNFLQYLNEHLDPKYMFDDDLGLMELFDGNQDSKYPYPVVGSCDVRQRDHSTKCLHHSHFVKKDLRMNSASCLDCTFSTRQKGMQSVISKHLKENDDVMDGGENLLVTSHKQSIKKTVQGTVKGLFSNKEKDLSSQMKPPKRCKNSRIRFCKLLVELCKEGTVDMFVNNNQWVKTRLLLVKLSCGYMLEFYQPSKPKSLRPDGGVFCHQILEIQETTALHTPDHQHSFIMKCVSGTEYKFRTTGVDELRSWVSNITYCMQQMNDLDRITGSHRPPLPARLHTTLPSSRTAQINDRRLSGTSVNSTLPDPPPPAPRIVSIPGSSVTSPGLGSASTLVSILTTSSDPGASRWTEYDMLEWPPSGLDYAIECQLGEYPWFHGTLTREEATRLVLEAQLGHGVFLVRRSETRHRDHVLTFNCHGRAKHLRFIIGVNGQCWIHTFKYPSVFDMLDNFRSNPIPLENGNAIDAILTEFVIVRNSSSSSLHRGASDRSQFGTSSRPIRTRSVSLQDLLVSEQNSEESVQSGRAVENPYTIV